MFESKAEDVFGRAFSHWWWRGGWRSLGVVVVVVLMAGRGGMSRMGIAAVKGKGMGCLG